MYTKYFGFNEKPFTLTPNPRFIYLSKNHKEAFAHLLYGINNHYGFIELIGEVGTGKTTVLRTLLSQLQEEHYRTALIFNPCLTGVELLRTISQEFGLSPKSDYANEILSDFNNFLLEETTNGRTVVLVIDEAQNLRPDVLEQIRLISNLETENDKLIQIILAGQPELATLLERPELRQLNQRIAVRYRLNPMSLHETRAYIRHRMEVAGETGGVSFTQFATRCVYMFSGGVPRMINILCDRCLLTAYGDERRRITAGVAVRGIRELLNAPRHKKLSRAFAGVTAVAVICIILSLFIPGLIPGKLNSGGRPVRPVTSSPMAAESSTASQDTAADAPRNDHRFAQLRQEIVSYNMNDSHLLAFNAIAEKWGAIPIRVFNGQFTVPDAYIRFAGRRELRVTEFKGSLEDVMRFDVPFLVVTRISGRLGPYCVAVTSTGENTATVSPQLFGNGTISKSDLKMIAEGTFYLIWQNSGHVPARLLPGDRRYEVRALQLLLQKAGTYRDGIDGYYGSATAKAVGDFQRKTGIPPNDNVGELTLAALAKYSPNQKNKPALSSPGSQK